MYRYIKGFKPQICIYLFMIYMYSIIYICYNLLHPQITDEQVLFF